MVNVPYADPDTGTELLIIKSVDETGLLAKAIDTAQSTGEEGMVVRAGDAIVKVNGASTIEGMRQNFLNDPSVDLYVLKNENIARFLRAAKTTLLEDHQRDMIRGTRNPGVRQCLGFCSDDSEANEDQESAVQKPKHCLTPGFLIPLDMINYASMKRITKSLTFRPNTLEIALYMFT